MKFLFSRLLLMHNVVLSQGNKILVSKETQLEQCLIGKQYECKLDNTVYKTIKYSLKYHKIFINRNFYGLGIHCVLCRFAILPA